MAETRRRRKVYPTALPYPKFPLTPRADGRFAKKVRGIQHTFGAKGDWQAALQEYHRVAVDVHAGRPVRGEVRDAITVDQCANVYLAERRKDVDASTLSLASWDKYRHSLAVFKRCIGATVPMASLGPEDFARFGAMLRKTLGSHAFNLSRAMVSSWLKYAAKAEWIRPVNLGVQFAKIPAGKMRGEKKNRLYSPADIRKMIAIAKPQLRAMILLAVNGGFGSSDCSALCRPAVDLRAKLIRYARVKTNIARTVPLWPETVKAIAGVLKLRPDDPHLFRTKSGNLWVRTVADGKRVITKDSVAQEFSKLLKSIGVKRPGGVGFYGLRHTFATFANEVRDSDARLHLMGRKLPGIDGDTYVEAVFVPRLKVVTDHVRKKILGK